MSSPEKLSQVALHLLADIYTGIMSQHNTHTHTHNLLSCRTRVIIGRNLSSRMNPNRRGCGLIVRGVMCDV